MGEDMLIVAVDIDDLTMARNTKCTILSFKDQLHEVFKIKYLRDLHWLLGIEVKRDCVKQTIMFSQCSYIDKIVERFSLQNTKPLTIPLDPHHQLTLVQCLVTLHQYKDMWDIPYHEAIGSLMYAALGTCLDIVFAVLFLSQF